MKKKILFVTCTRADYGKLKSTIINMIVYIICLKGRAAAESCHDN